MADILFNHQSVVANLGCVPSFQIHLPRKCFVFYVGFLLSATLYWFSPQKINQLTKQIDFILDFLLRESWYKPLFFIVQLNPTFFQIQLFQTVHVQRVTKISCTALRLFIKLCLALMTCTLCCQLSCLDCCHWVAKQKYF